MATIHSIEINAATSSQAISPIQAGELLGTARGERQVCTVLDGAGSVGALGCRSAF